MLLHRSQNQQINKQPVVSDNPGDVGNNLRKTLACWVFGRDKRAVTVRVHALAFHRNGDKDLNLGHPGLGQLKGP